MPWIDSCSIDFLFDKEVLCCVKCSLSFPWGNVAKQVSSIRRKFEPFFKNIWLVSTVRSWGTANTPARPKWAIRFDFKPWSRIQFSEKLKEFNGEWETPTCCLLHTDVLLGLLFDLKVEALCYSETWAEFHRTTWRCIPEDGTLQLTRNLRNEINGLNMVWNDFIHGLTERLLAYQGLYSMELFQCIYRVSNPHSRIFTYFPCSVRNYQFMVSSCVLVPLWWFMEEAMGYSKLKQ
jgi:hypothetical protein